ncbi:unnamed protein product, partial [marine sediment metagenome]
LFDAIKKGNIDEMNWADLAYDNIASIFALGSQNTTDLVTPIADWTTRDTQGAVNIQGSTDINMEINIMGFFLYAKEIIKRIVEEAGFTVSYDANLPADFDTIALACPVTKFFEASEVGQVSLTAEVYKNIDQAVTNAIVRATWEDATSGGSEWDAGNNQWLLTITSEVKVVVSGTYGHIETGTRPPSFIRIYHNAAVVATFSIDTFIPAGTIIYLTATIAGVPGDIIWVELESQVIQTQITLESGTIFSINT